MTSPGPRSLEAEGEVGSLEVHDDLAVLGGLEVEEGEEGPQVGVGLLHPPDHEDQLQEEIQVLKGNTEAMVYQGCRGEYL